MTTPGWVEEKKERSRLLSILLLEAEEAEQAPGHRRRSIRTGRRRAVGTGRRRSLSTGRRGSLRTGRRRS
jgi:hypothetical protein